MYTAIFFYTVISDSNLLWVSRSHAYTKSPSPQARDLRGQTCLHLASQNGDLGQELSFVPPDTLLCIDACETRSCASFAG